ncbi:hypothetical protein MJO28_009529 [Puccinia striiformis f. sp. tritici]|nr:hypothetical protein MJO28_009529 [Puccinia striiformis f. sp. tritici]
MPQGSKGENLLPHEDLDQAFLTQIYNQFQKLPANKKESFIKKFRWLLDQTDVLAPPEDPLEQQHEG